MSVNRKIKIMVAVAAMWVVLCAVVAGAAEPSNTEHRTPNIQHRTAADISIRPLVAVRGGGWEAGVSFGWAWGPGGKAKANDPTCDAAGRTAYVERAVPLWRASPGELVAAAGNGVADINAVVQARDEAPRIPVEWPAWRRGVAHVGRHFEYRRTEYTVGGIVAAVAAAVGIAIEEERSGDAAAPAADPPKDAALVVVGTGNTVTLTDETGTASGQVYIAGENNTVTVVRKEPEED